MNNIIRIFTRLSSLIRDFIRFATENWFLTLLFSLLGFCIFMLIYSSVQSYKNRNKYEKAIENIKHPVPETRIINQDSIFVTTSGSNVTIQVSGDNNSAEVNSDVDSSPSENSDSPGLPTVHYFKDYQTGLCYANILNCTDDEEYFIVVPCERLNYPIDSILPYTLPERIDE